MKLIVGLGNPGKEYEKTPHNVGFLTIEQLASDAGLNMSLNKKLICNEVTTVINESKVVLMQPLSFMNLSGGPVANIMKYYKITIDDLIVVHDDIDLEFGQIKLKLGGSDAGHNGLRSISKSLGNLGGNNYHRIRIGVGRQTAVTSPFKSSQLKYIPQIIDDACDAVKSLLKNGLLKTQTDFHNKFIK